MSRLYHPISADDAFFSITSAKHRHLAWSLLGPSLLDTTWAPEYPEWLPQLDALLNTPVPSEARSARLGLVFEHLWHHWLEHSQWHWQANIQITEAGQTLGELDLLIQPPKRQAMHLELALKFYAGIGDDWIGPNRRDYLAEKLAHTQSRQLALSSNQATKQLLDQPQYSGQWSELLPLAIMRGCLFYPANPEIKTGLPTGIADDHWRGQWCHYGEVRDWLPNAHWYLIAKDEWISPVLCQLSISNMELYQLLDLHFRYLSIPVCLARVESGRHGWGEIERWFIMPDHWPAKTVSPAPL